MNNPRLKPFKAIIVGAGLSGLVLANIFKRTGIDFILLEAQHQIDGRVGFIYGCWPNAARILDQIDCWDDLVQATEPVAGNDVRLPDGSALISGRNGSIDPNIFGYDMRCTERHILIRILLEKLGGDKRIITGERVATIVHHTDGVQVLSESGRTYAGDIVVGCDGVHSVVRSLLWERADEVQPGLIGTQDKQVLTSSYRSLLGVAPPIPGLDKNVTTHVQGKGRCTTIITSTHNTQFFICIKEKKTTHVLDKITYTPQDMEAEAASMADQPVNKEEGVVFGDIWSKRERTYLCRVEEGIQPQWSFGRMVLVGDAAHKMTPIGAHGGNCGIESAAGLANALHKHLLRSDQSIDDNAIQQAFKAYQQKREPRVRYFYGKVYKSTRLFSYDNWLLWFVARYVMPLMNNNEMLTGLFEDAESVDALAGPARARGFKDLVPAKTETRQSNGLSKTVVGLGSTVLSVLSRTLQGTMRMWDSSAKTKEQ